MKTFFCLSLTVLVLFCTSNLQAQYIKRINCGGATATDGSKTFESDASASGITYNGELTNSSLTYAGFSEPYKSIRYTKNASMHYTFSNLTAGQYQVLLHFGEVYHGVAPNTNPDTRKFHVDIQGQRVKTDLNIMSETAGGTVYTIDQTVTVDGSTNNELVLLFSKGSGNDPIINAIEVLEQANTPYKQGVPGGSNIQENSVSLSWSRDDTVPMESYNIYSEEVGSAGGYVLNNNQTGSYPNADAIGLQPDTDYRFKVSAVGVGSPGNEGPLSDASAIIRTLPSSGGSGYWVKSGSDIYYNSGKVGVGTTTPSNSLTVSGDDLNEATLLIRNTSYSSTDNTGTASLQFGFANHFGPVVEATKFSTNISGLNFYGEYGFNVPQLAMTIKPNSAGPRVGIGTDNPDETLTVKGTIHTQEVKVDLLGAVAPDYVFLKDYKLPTLEEVKQHINKNGHLPNVPSAKEMEEQGINLKEMNLKLLEKIEELTLYILEQNASQQRLEQRISELENKFEN